MEVSRQEITQSKVHLFPEYVEETFQPHEAVITYLSQTTVNTWVNSYHVILKENSQEVKTNLNSTQAPGYDLIVGEVLINRCRIYDKACTSSIESIKHNHVLNNW